MNDAEIYNKYDRHLVARNNRRLAAEDRYLGRMEKKEAAAEKLIGELVRGGETVFYVNCLDRRGRPTGKTRESASQYELVSFCVRNHYV